VLSGNALLTAVVRFAQQKALALNAQFSLAANGAKRFRILPHLPSPEARKTSVAAFGSFMGGYHSLKWRDFTFPGQLPCRSGPPEEGRTHSACVCTGEGSLRPAQPYHYIPHRTAKLHPIASCSRTAPSPTSLVMPRGAKKLTAFHLTGAIPRGIECHAFRN
jgi:hypothetical protein